MVFIHVHWIFNSSTHSLFILSVDVGLFRYLWVLLFSLSVVLVLIWTKCSLLFLNFCLWSYLGVPPRTISMVKPFPHEGDSPHFTSRWLVLRKVLRNQTRRTIQVCCCAKEHADRRRDQSEREMRSSMYCLSFRCLVWGRRWGGDLYVACPVVPKKTSSCRRTINGGRSQRRTKKMVTVHVIVFHIFLIS